MKNITQHSFQDIIQTGRFDNATEREMQIIFNELGITEKVLVGSFDTISFAAIDNKCIPLIKFLRMKGEINDKHLFKKRAIDSNDTEIMKHASVFKGINFIGRDRLYALERCAEISYQYLYDIEQWVVGSEDLAKAQHCSVMFPHILQLARTTNIRTIERAITTYTFSLDCLFQLLDSDWDWSRERNKIPLLLLDTYPEHKKELIAYFAKNKRITRMAINLRQSELLPDVMKKIFLIKD